MMTILKFWTVLIKESKNKGPQLHHFRTHNLKCEQTYLETCWKQCIEDEVELPVDSVRIYNDNGELVRVQTRDQSMDVQTNSHMIQNHR